MTSAQNHRWAEWLRTLLDIIWRFSGGFRLAALVRGSRIAFSAGVVSPLRLYLGHGVTVQRGAIIHCGGKHWCNYGGHVSLGDGVVVGPHCIIYGAGGIDIGAFTHLGPGVQLISQAGLHNENRLRPVPSYTFTPIRIGTGSWIGAGSVVLGGSRIGRCVTVAPNSVVAGQIPDYATVGGNPARVIYWNSRLRNDDFSAID